MKVSFTDIQPFLQKNGRKFPYNQVSKTCRSFYPKWVVLKERHGQTNVTLPSSAIDKRTFNHLIITKQAWPLSPFMDQILDHVESWGREEDASQYRNVLGWIAHICIEGIRRDNLGLLYDCVAFRVRDIVQEYTGSRITSLTRLLLNNWREAFFRMYASGLTDLRH